MCLLCHIQKCIFQNCWMDFELLKEIRNFQKFFELKLGLNEHECDDFFFPAGINNSFTPRFFLKLRVFPQMTLRLGSISLLQFYCAALFVFVDITCYSGFCWVLKSLIYRYGFSFASWDLNCGSKYADVKGKVNNFPGRLTGSLNIDINCI